MTDPILLCPAGAPEHEWLALRRTGIGASEVAAAMGISPYQSPFGLYWSKVEGWDLADTSDMEAGRRMEAAIADWAADVIDPHENLVFRPAGLYRSGERAWQLATPDRLIYESCPECGGRGVVVVDSLPGWAAVCTPCKGLGYRPPLLGVLEVKHPFSWDGFGEPGTNEVPLHFDVQVQQQCDVLGVDEWFLAAYANHELRIYRGHRDEADLRVIRNAGGKAWDSIVNRIEPDVDGHPATLATLRQLHPSVDDYEVEVDVDFAEGYRRARAARKRAEELVDRYEARARHMLGTGRRLMCGRKLVLSRSVFERGGEDTDIYALDEGRPTVDRLNPGRADSYVRSS